MPRTSLLVHVSMIVIAGAIGFLYIYPTIGQIRDNQDAAVLFSREVTHVSGVNAQLQQKLMSINNIPLESKQKLVTYMPDTLDDVMFLRIMEAILINSGIEPTSLQFGSGKDGNNSQDTNENSLEESSSVTNEKTVQNTILVAFEVDEASLFSFFSAVEKSSVPFVLKEAVLAPIKGGGVSAELLYSVHALAAVDSSTASVSNDGGMEMNDDLAF